ncbi:hypothetical protein [Flagellimonas meishanensis]|uniref:hypothetical protein n=1 Tax=Flagellimonas meishanensis TaxID=2873264 RepID=UPI001CA631DC|nr:hypothetical protein [[Muricauda] meishanensis]
MFDQEQRQYKNHKGNKDPGNTFIISLVQFFVLAVGKYHKKGEGNNKKQGKDQLSGTEHILYFYAKLNQITSNEK